MQEAMLWLGLARDAQDRLIVWTARPRAEQIRVARNLEWIAC